jgi:hypothetical protein
VPGVSYVQLAIEIRETNGRLLSLLGALSAPDTSCSAAARNPTHEKIIGLCRELHHVHGLLASCSVVLPGNKDQHTTELRQQVQQLRDILPAAHKLLLGERARLGLQNKAVSDAFEWTRLSCQTF